MYIGIPTQDVSSHLNQERTKFAPGFAVTARCLDGIVEAIEGTTGGWFAMGVQFHPEENIGTKLDICVFEQLVLGVRRSCKLRMVA